MLTKEEEIELAGMMVLVDLCNLAQQQGNRTKELKQAKREAEAAIKNITDLLTQEEMNQVINRYIIERAKAKSLNK
jgi:G3E family GTPase